MMHYFVENFGLGSGWLFTTLIITLRYLIFAGITFTIFYIIQKNAWFHRKIQQKFPGKKHITHEIKYSFITMFILAGTVLLVYMANMAGLTQLYPKIQDYGWGYFIFSIFFMIMYHDFYFYWIHRFMHLPSVYRVVHRVHHHSHDPSPWAAFAFHPLEAILEFSVIHMVFILPVHPLALFIFTTFSLLMNVMGHLGFEMFPKKFVSKGLGKWYNTATHHNMHHQLVHYNYGLYTNIWDRAFGTNHPDYERRFEEVKSRVPER